MSDMHARKQAEADGFQDGWRAALARVKAGDSPDDLSASIPSGPFDAAKKFLLRVAETNGAIVSSAAAHEIEIADARVRGDWLVIDSLGFILRFKDWRERAEKAIHAEATAPSRPPEGQKGSRLSIEELWRQRLYPNIDSATFHKYIADATTAGWDETRKGIAEGWPHTTTLELLQHVQAGHAPFNCDGVIECSCGTSFTVPERLTAAAPSLPPPHAEREPFIVATWATNYTDMHAGDPSPIDVRVWNAFQAGAERGRKWAERNPAAAPSLPPEGWQPK